MFVPDESLGLDTSPARRRKDLKTIIDIVLHTPVAEGALVDLDGTIPMSQMKDKTVDVQSAIVLRMANQAVKGDIKSAEWIGKYGGLEPVREQKVTMELPTFVVNEAQLPDEVREAIALEAAIPIISEDEEEEHADQVQ